MYEVELEDHVEGQVIDPEDFIRVVRCKDCVHEGLFDCPMCYIEKQELVFVNHDPNFYCGFGERK